MGKGLGSSSAVFSAMAALANGRPAAAANAKFADVEPRGTKGRLERLPRLDLESHDNFLTGFRDWVNSDLERAARTRGREILTENGIGPRDKVPLEQIVSLMENDAIIGMRVHNWINCQRLMWTALRDEFHANADAYLAEMESADKAGPGSLELNTGLVIPEYATHEIHGQLGGYVGDPFAGHVYHYGTNNFYAGHNDQDQLHTGMALSIPTPQTGSVRRILDLGCGTGQLSIALKERFPDAEVWGIDIGAPMVRYAHMRAVDLDVDVNFAQRLAEDSGFPDGHFDMVASYILHHELPADISQKVIQESYRVLRPGGVFYPIDFYTGILQPPRSAWDKFGWWWTHRWNHEVWYYEYASLNFPREMAKAGFQSGLLDATDDVKAVAESLSRDGGTKNIIGIKPV